MKKISKNISYQNYHKYYTEQLNKLESKIFQKKLQIHKYFTKSHFYHLLIKNVLDGIFNSFKIADIHHCHFFRSVERGSGACKNFFSQHRLKFNFIVSYTWQCAFILCLYRLLNIKKQNWTIKWKTQKKKMVVEETKYLNDNSKWVSKLAYYWWVVVYSTYLCRKMHYVKYDTMTILICTLPSSTFHIQQLAYP